MVASSPPGATFEVQVWPTVPLTVAVAADRRQPLPTAVTAGFSASDPNDHRFPKGEVPCSVDAETRRISCEIPIGGPFDLALRAPGYASAYAWDLVHRRDAPAKPPAWRLARGGSVTGFVQASGRDLDPARCTVALEPVVADLQGSEREVTQLEKRGASVHPDRRGFFQLADVAPGSYRIRAHQEGYTEAVAGPVTVAKDEESSLGSPLELVRPFGLEVDVEPRDRHPPAAVADPARPARIRQLPGHPRLRPANLAPGRRALPRPLPGVLRGPGRGLERKHVVRRPDRAPRPGSAALRLAPAARGLGHRDPRQRPARDRPGVPQPARGGGHLGDERRRTGATRSSCLERTSPGRSRSVPPATTR